MTFGSYLRSAWPTVAILCVASLLTCMVLEVSGTSAPLLSLVACVLIGSSVLLLVVDYLRKRAFACELDSLADQQGHALWANELIDRPDFIEGQLAYDALCAVSKAANDEVAGYRRQTNDYREYVETWVHEAKSPLAAAHLMIENIEDELSAVGEDPIDEEVLFSRIRALDEELDRMEGYVEQALFYARSEAVERDYLIREYGLKDLVSAALRANSRMLISARVAPFRRNLDYRVFTDEKWMLFIFGQIIQNSVKYARDEGASIEFSACLRDEGLATERVELSIRDNGCGVSAADLPRVFEKGFTGAAGRSGKRSTGIGLYLVKRLCDKMGVGIDADSVAGEGFTVILSFSTNRFHYFE